MALKPSDDDLNTLFDAALAFGPDWRRPVVELAVERLPGRPPEYLHAIAAAVELCRETIEAQIAGEYERLAGAWSQVASRDADRWILSRFSWMTAENRRHAISQAVYYAWHG